MELTREQQDILNGSEGEVMAKVMKSLVMYGETFGADKMVPVTSEYGHTVISFGIGVMKPVYDLYDQLIEAGALQQAASFPPTPCLWTRTCRVSFCCRTSSSSTSCTPSRSRYEEQLRKARHYVRPTPTPAPAIWTRWATSPKRARCSPGRESQRGGLRQQRARRAGATATPAC